MAIDTSLVTLANRIATAASKVTAASATSSRLFYASADGWVCFGNPAQANVAAIGLRNSPRLYASATAAADATALNAVLTPAVTATQAAALATAQAAYDAVAPAFAITSAGQTLIAQQVSPAQPAPAKVG